MRKKSWAIFVFALASLTCLVVGSGSAPLHAESCADVFFDPDQTDCIINGVCQPNIGEDCETCPEDCREKSNGPPSGRYCCGDTISCDDSRCSEGGYDCEAAFAVTEINLTSNDLVAPLTVHVFEDENGKWAVITTEGAGTNPPPHVLLVDLESEAVVSSLALDSVPGWETELVEVNDVPCVGSCPRRLYVNLPDDDVILIVDVDTSTPKVVEKSPSHFCHVPEGALSGLEGVTGLAVNVGTPTNNYTHGVIVHDGAGGEIYGITVASNSRFDSNDCGDFPVEEGGGVMHDVAYATDGSSRMALITFFNGNDVRLIAHNASLTPRDRNGECEVAFGCLFLYDHRYTFDYTEALEPVGVRVGSDGDRAYTINQNSVAGPNSASVSTFDLDLSAADKILEDVLEISCGDEFRGDAMLDRSEQWLLVPDSTGNSLRVLNVSDESPSCYCEIGLPSTELISVDNHRIPERLQEEFYLVDKGSNKLFRIDSSLPAWKMDLEPGPYGPPSGDNWVSLPFDNPFVSAEDVCLGLGPLATVADFDPVSGTLQTHFCGLAGDFNLTPGRAIKIVVSAPNTIELFGDHDPGLQITLAPIGTPPAGDNWVSVPLNTTAKTVEDLCDEIPEAITIVSLDPVGAYSTWFCGAPPPPPWFRFQLVKGEGVMIRVSETAVWTPSVY